MSKQELIEAINELAASGELVIFLSKAGELYEVKQDSEQPAACINGDCIQINLDEK